MANNPTLEEFIETYIQNKAKSSTKESYDDWLRSNGINTEKIYTDSIRGIEADYQKAKSSFGANAESLAELGLTSSGYSDYLNGKAYSDMQKSKYLAKNEYAKSLNENAAGYKEYVEKLTESENESFRTATKEIFDRGIIDYGLAYQYAIGAGLSEDAAVVAAKTASDAARATLKESIMKTILSQKLTSGQTKEYALGLGLSAEEAEELAKYASSINEYVSTSGYSKGYMDYLEEKLTTR